MSCWALLPIKARADCKTRLASVLSPAQRLTLVRTVLLQVLQTLQISKRLDHIAVVSPERDCIPTCIEVLPELGQDLNSTLFAAMGLARRRGATTVVILPSDLPTIRPGEIEVLLNAAGDTGVAIAPDDRGVGTNALCLPASLDLPLQFGPGSFRAHCESVRLHGLVPAVIRSPGLSFDLDNSADLIRYSAQPARIRSYTLRDLE